MEGRRESICFAALLFLVAVALAAHGAPGGACRAVAGHSGILVRVQLVDLFGPELLRLVSLGLEGRVRVEVELVRRRPFWFSRRVARESVEAVVTRDPSGEGFLLDGERPLPDPSRLPIERIALPAPGGDPERHEAQVRVQLRVITPASLGRMAAWVAGGKEEERSALSAGLFSLIADELARTLEFSCPVRRR